MDGIKLKSLYEGDSITIYRVEDEEGEVGFDITFFDSVTVHFVKEEFNELLEILHQIQPED
jgi:hypothetical protein